MLDFCVWECGGSTRVIHKGLKGLAVCAESLPSFLLACDSLCCKPKGKREGVELLLLGIHGEVAQERSPGLLGPGDLDGILLLLCCFLSL